MLLPASSEHPSKEGPVAGGGLGPVAGVCRRASRWARRLAVQAM